MASPINNRSPADVDGLSRNAAVPAIRLAAVLALIVIALTALDRFLARIESAELRGSAQSSYLSGTRLLASGKAGGAVDEFRTAHALDRGNIDYELGLITALTEAGRMTEADPLMNDALQREPNDGRTNLIAARLAAKRKNVEQAESYYHRAIYGGWRDNAASRRLASRIELVDLLARNHQKQELLGELISLQAEAPADLTTQRRLAELYLQANSPARAADVYRSLTGKNPEDRDAWAGLGEASLENGDYREAHLAFYRAFLRQADDPAARARLELLNTVTALDPTPRQLPTAEKYRRSLAILDLARASLEQCTTKDTGSRSGDVEQLLANADAAAKNRGVRVTNELAEAALSLAEKIWHERLTACGAAGTNDEALRLIMEKLAL
jgi:thioredoxin-like negative regulator of GroEL